MATIQERLKLLEDTIGADRITITIKPGITGAQFYKHINGDTIEITEQEANKIKCNPGEDIEVILPPGFDM